VEFDVMYNETQDDTDGDGEVDHGRADNVNQYGIGMVEFARKLRERMSEQIEQLQRERDDATSRLASLANEIARMKNGSSELLKLRGEVAQLRASLAASRQSKTTESIDPTETAVRSWLGRVKPVRQRLEDWPGKKTPELDLLTEQDWLNATANHQLDTEADIRETMSELRTVAKRKFSENFKNALAEYLKVNNQQYPTDLLQLLPYFATDVSPILAGYEIAKPGTVHPPSPGPADGQKVETWAMVERNGPADPEYDHTFVFYSGGHYQYGPVRRH
jgi:hypothetical protein